MSQKLIKTIFSALAAVALTGCDVHEFPEALVEPEDVSVILHLDYTMELPPYKDIIYTPNTSRSPFPSDQLDVRYIVNYYKSTNGRDFPTQPTGRVVVSKDVIEDLNHDIELTLKPGLYKFHVWSDYTRQGTLDDRYYKTDDFSSITLVFPHSGCDDYRDAFRGEEKSVVLPDEVNEINVGMERPLGKYRFIATDFDRFLSRAEEALRAEWEASRQEDPDGAPAEMPAVDVNDYKVIIRYPGFMPHVFNMHTNRPADARTGVSYEGQIVRLNEQEAELGFDYVFINGSEAPYTVCVEIYDKKGQLVGASGNIDVPLMRSMLTTVKGEFLTSRAQGGVGINTDFDGEYNIVIP